MAYKSPAAIKEAAYEKQNRKMRSKHKSETGKTLGSRQTSGTGKRRVSFACRFAGMAGASVPSLDNIIDKHDQIFLLYNMNLVAHQHWSSRALGVKVVRTPDSMYGPKCPMLRR